MTTPATPSYVNQNGMVLDILVSKGRRDTRAAKRLPCKLLKLQYRVQRVMITDKLASQGTASVRRCRLSSTGSTKA